MSAPAPARAVPSRGPMLSGADLHADVATLRHAYETLHPGLYRYATAAEMNARFDALDTELGRGAPLSEAFRAFSVFAASVKCGHTFANPANQSKAVRAALFEGPHVPFFFRWLDGRMIVTGSSVPDARLPAGAEVLSVNGVEARALLAKLFTVARADGGNDAKRLANVERRGNERVEPFDVFLPLFVPVDGDTFTLDVALQGGRRTRLVVDRERADRAHDVAAPAPRAKADDAPLWALRYLDDGTPYLAMPTWVTYQTKWDWRGDLRAMFASLKAKEAKALVVDLRGNEGGEDVGNTILGHLREAPLVVDVPLRLTRYRRVPDDLRPVLDTWDKSFFDWGDAATPRGDGFFRMTKYDDGPTGDVIAPLAPFVPLRLVVLVDGANSSATFQFAQLVQRYHLGALIGEPTGGNQRGINGGAFFFLRLPKSGIELDLPLIGRFPQDRALADIPDTGLAPDRLVMPTVADIASGRDAALETARQMVAAPR